MNKNPNIIIFNPDSYRGDVLHHLGNAGAVTPNLDALVENGAVSYANAFAQNPVCTPSRCSFMTGWYPHVHGHRSMKNLLKDYEPNLLSVLRSNDYHVWWGGKNDLFAAENKDDYSKICDTKYSGEKIFQGYFQPPAIPLEDPRHTVFYRGVMTREDGDEKHLNRDLSKVLGAVDFITSCSDENPFCVYLPLSSPHPAYAVEKEYYDLIDPDKLPPRLPVPENDLPLLDALREAYRSHDVSEDDWLELKRVYYGMCARVDAMLGQVVDALIHNGLYDNTLIIFLSDHGDFTGDYALPEKTHASLQDCLLRVPFIIKPPASFHAREGIRNHLTELVDMTATIYDMLGLEPGYDHQGHSLCDSLRGGDREIRRAVYAEVGTRPEEGHYKNPKGKKRPPTSFYGMQSKVNRPFREAGTYAVSARTKKYKYIRRAYVDHNELYDLDNDPGELRNLSGGEEYSEVEKSMEELLLDFFMTTADVLPHKQDSRNA